ncbi:lantibiotic dehydratase [Sphingobacterium multivorum]|uniref:lantibiotic dehydratase n=1 Tax=Sphingobacterium multivorum TaxID=28454 RepID=UPI0028ABB8A4|nr:thiopeptide-type bacteriocin biosynthesis protein [Sphingobacterium multivorum]
MKPELLTKVLYRIPQFPIDAELHHCWDDLKKSIKTASAYFYSLIKDIDARDVVNQSEAVQFTIAKYFNRAKLRSTPYGSFASIGVCSLADGVSGILIEEHRTEQKFVDWKLTDAIRKYWKEKEEDLMLQTNSSCYQVGNEIRYIYKDGDQFQLSDIPFYPEIWKILQICEYSCPLDLLLDKMDGSIPEATSLLEIVRELIDCQLLITQYHPNILGEDYFSRLGLNHEIKDHEYIISRANPISGVVNIGQFKVLEEYIGWAMGRINTERQTDDLSNFITAFRKKYDQASIPVMEALDPIIGIGYGGMEHPGNLSSFIQSVQEHNNQSGHGKKDDFKQQLYSLLMENFGNREIDLSKLDFTVQSNYTPALPNTFSAIVKIIDDQVILDHLGGASASALLGRFNMADPQVLKMGEEIVEIEKQANFGVLFFDIAYMGEPSVDNVNRRQHTYDLELNILSYGLDDHVRLKLSDIYLQLSGEELILYSKSKAKRLIPRLSTAYNYSRSDLSVFRLLCDVMTQGLQSTLIPDLQGLFPVAKRLPRLCYKHLILRGACSEITFINTFDHLQVFQDYINEQGLGRYIDAGFGDQTLLLDCYVQQDMELLRSILKIKKKLWIREGFVEKNTIIRDKKGKQYKSELVLSFFHKNRVYHPLKPRYEIGDTERDFVPGNAWLYYELYCHPAASNNILTDHLYVLIESLQSVIENWFFIRFNEGGEHLRLRIKTVNKERLWKVFTDMEQLTAKLHKQGLVQDTKICTYRRELERYDEGDIDKIEDLFHKDSTYILSILRQNRTTGEHYLLIIQLMTAVGKEIFSVGEFIEMAKGQCKAFNEEFHMGETQFKALNKEFKEWGASLNGGQLLSDKGQEHAGCYIAILKNVRFESRVDYFCDLFHMHINRLFADRQRIHEMIVYHYLVKWVLKSYYRLKKGIGATEQAFE